jgi:nucleoside-diphosphate-sugar epimerase
MSVRCAVTGGAGFIGGRLASRLAREGHEVLVVDRHRTPASAVVADVTRPEQVERAFEDFRPTIVYHLAGASDAREVRRDPVSGIQSHVVGTCSVLEAAHRAGSVQVVVASSIFVYAATPPGQVSESELFLPEGGGHVHVTGFIGRELLARDYFRAYGLSTTIFRLAPVYGPGMWGGLALRSFIDAARAGGPIVVYGDGSDKRRFLFIDDLVDAFVRAQGLPPGMHAFNILGPRDVTVNELARLVADHFGGIAVVHRDEPARLGELDCSRRTIVDGSAQRELGWEPRVDIVEGLQLTLVGDPAACASA